MTYLATVLPTYMKDSLLCYTPVNSKIADGAPDIATCNSNGYMYEIKNKKVTRSLNLPGKGVSIRCSYLIQNEKPQLFYTVLTECRKLLIIGRTSISLKVMRTYGEVKEFEIYDFKCLGFPQIKISFISGADDLVCTFLVEEPETIKADDDMLVIDEDNEPSPLVESLNEKLQILNKHIDDLSEECNLLRKQFSSRESPTEFGMVSVGPVRFSSPFRKETPPLVKICDRWLRVVGNELVLGIMIRNCSSEVLHDVELLFSQPEITDYTYRIFHSSNDLSSQLFAAPAEHRTLANPGNAIWVIGTFPVPTFLYQSTLSVAYCLTSGDLKSPVARDSFEVTVLDIASMSSRAADEEFTVEDLMAIRSVKSETRLLLRTEDVDLGSLLVNHLGFRKVKSFGVELFRCTAAYPNDAFIAYQQITRNPSVWKLLLLTSEDPQIYFIVNALYDLLPDDTAISCSGGAAIEFAMIHWRPNGINFYDTYKAKKAREEAEARLRNWKEIEKYANDLLS